MTANGGRSVVFVISVLLQSCQAEVLGDSAVLVQANVKRTMRKSDPDNGEGVDISQTEVQTNGSVTDINHTQVQTNGTVTDINQTEVQTNGSVTDIGQTQVQTNGSVTDINHTQVQTNGTVTDINHTQVETNGSVTDIDHTQVQTNGTVTDINHTQVETNGTVTEVNATDVQITENVQVSFDIFFEANSTLANSTSAEANSTSAEANSTSASANGTSAEANSTSAEANSTSANTSRTLMQLFSKRDDELKPKSSKLLKLIARNMSSDLITHVTDSIKQIFVDAINGTDPAHITVSAVEHEGRFSVVVTIVTVSGGPSLQSIQSELEQVKTHVAQSISTNVGDILQVQGFSMSPVDATTMSVSMTTNTEIEHASGVVSTPDHTGRNCVIVIAVIAVVILVCHFLYTASEDKL